MVHLPRRRTPLVVAAAMAVLAIGSAPGFARTLSWRSLDVSARLDADGVLHVRERHEMVFDGDWNGGERIFRRALGQKLELTRIARELPDGTLRDLEPGDLEAVDEYDWADSATLRWRSRLPSDPPFAEATIPYVLEYTLSNILRRQEDLYFLDHDFAFPDREWPIEHFSLDLALDPVWQPAWPIQTRAERTGLAPGESFVVNAALAYQGDVPPAGVAVPAPVWVRRGIALGLVFGIAALLVRWGKREARAGRFEKLPDLDHIDRAWLDEHVFAMPPEEAGALWDESTGGAEVAAMLARLELEGKISSRVEEGKGWFSGPELHLRRVVPREEFGSTELPLIDALFLGKETTSTERVRKHYRSRGFDPSGKLGTVKSRAAAFGGRKGRPDKPSRRPALVLAGAALALFGLGALLGGGVDILVAGLAAGLGLAFYGWAAGAAASWRSRVHRLGRGAIGIAIPLGVLTWGAFALVLDPERPLRPATLGGIALLTLAFWTSVTHQAMTRQSPERLAARRRLLAARQWFRRELRKDSPALEDAWIPWMIAFGLGRWIGRWSVAHVPSSSSSGSSFGSGSSSGSFGGSGGGFTGGGGAFGGAGATAGWAAAVSGMAAGVAAPSSSSGGGGGGGGGGSSSGGGGGGGW